MFEMVNFISSTIKESFIHSYICLRTYGWDTCYQPMLAVHAGFKFNYLDLLFLFLILEMKNFFMGSNNSLVIRFRKFLFSPCGISNVTSIFFSATVFGSILLRGPTEKANVSRKAESQIGQKKAKFLYHFLVNDFNG